MRFRFFRFFRFLSFFAALAVFVGVGVGVVYANPFCHALRVARLKSEEMGNPEQSPLGTLVQEYLQAPEGSNQRRILGVRLVQRFQKSIDFFSREYSRKTGFRIEQNELAQHAWLNLLEQIESLKKRSTNSVNISFFNKRIEGSLVDYLRGKSFLVRPSRSILMAATELDLLERKAAAEQGTSLSYLQRAQRVSTEIAESLTGSSDHKDANYSQPNFVGTPEWVNAVLLVHQNFWQEQAPTSPLKAAADVPQGGNRGRTRGMNDWTSIQAEDLRADGYPTISDYSRQAADPSFAHEQIEFHERVQANYNRLPVEQKKLVDEIVAWILNGGHTQGELESPDLIQRKISEIEKKGGLGIDGIAGFWAAKGISPSAGSHRYETLMRQLLAPPRP